MLSKEMIREVVTLRNNEDCNVIKEVQEIGKSDLKELFYNINENTGLNKVIYVTAKDLEVGTIGGGYKYTEKIKDTVGKTIIVTNVLIKNRTEEDAQRGGRAGEIMAVKGDYIKEDGKVKILTSSIDEDFIDKLYCVEFKRPEFSQRIDVINKRLKENTRTNEEDLRRAKDKWNRAQSNIREYKDRIVTELRQAKQHSLTIAALESQKEKDFTNDLSALAGHRYFEDLRMEDSKIVFTTTYIDIVDPNNTDVVFEGNKYEIKVDLRDNDVFFYGLDKSRCHKSCWSDKDPHPHVSGRDGHACLGNINATLVELTEAREIYALFISLTNFLQTFNIEDYAGKKIKNWNVKGGGEHPYNASYKCTSCNEEFESESDIRHCGGCGAVLCYDCGEWHEEDDTVYCDDCYEANTYKCDECDDRVEDNDELTKCSVCGKDLCEDCLYTVGGVHYCREHADEENRRREAERQATEATPVQPANTFKCEHCNRDVELGAKQEWISEDGSIIDVCPDCIEELSSN